MREREHVEFTREQLYEFVWSKPMTEIAADFGMSSVAFAKHCKKVNVPIPGRGYWQRIEHGHKEKSSPLPKMRSGVPATICIPKYNSPPPTKPMEIPVVVIGDTLTKPHPVITQVQQKLRGPRGEEYDGIAGSGHAVFYASKATRSRAFRILDALIKALEARGHTCRFGEAGHGRDRHALHVVIPNMPQVEMWLIEHLTRSDHPLTEKEKQDEARYGWSMATKYDFANSGQLALEIDPPWKPEGMRRRWTDGKKRRLEDQLGEVVIGIERAAEGWRAIEEERERENREREDEQRRAEESEHRAKYKSALAADLRRMARSWATASEIRSFLNAVDDALPTSDQGEGLRNWLQWASTYADKLDPLSAPYLISKELEPDVSELIVAAEDLAADDDL